VVENDASKANVSKRSATLFQLGLRLYQNYCQVLDVVFFKSVIHAWIMRILNLNQIFTSWHNTNQSPNLSKPGTTCFSTAENVKGTIQHYLVKNKQILENLIVR